MRWPKIGELGEQIAMGLYLVLDYLPVCEDGQKSITGVVGECPPIAWKARRTRRVVGQYVRQQCPCHPARVLRRVSTGVLQRVREPGNETAIVCRLTREVGISLRADEQDSLRGQRAAIRLDPLPACTVERAGPQAKPLFAEIEHKIKRTKLSKEAREKAQHELKQRWHEGSA